MGVFERLFGSGWSLAAGRDAVASPVPMQGLPTDGGLTATVSPLTALGLSAVWRSLDILANGVSQLDWQERRGNLELPPSRLVRRPMAQRTRREWISLVVSTLALYDVAYLLRVPPYDFEGVPLALWPIDPTIISPAVVDVWSLLPPSQYRVRGQVVDASDLVILHRSPQPTIFDTVGGVIQLARATFAAAIAAERYASRFWQAGGAPNTVLETDATLTDTEATSMSDRWAVHRAKGPDHAAVLSGGLKYKPSGADPTTQSAVEARRELVADIGRYFGIPTAILNAPTGDSETYQTTEAQGIHLLTFTLRNYIEAIEDAITDQLPGGRELEIDEAPLTHGSHYQRAQAYQLATAGRAWMTPDEVRAAEGLPPIENPDDLLPPQQTRVSIKPAGGAPNVPAAQ